MKRIIAFALTLVFVSGCVPGVFADKSKNTLFNESISSYEHCNFYDEIKDVGFAGDGSIYVTMHHEVSDVGKVYTEEDFPELDVKIIEDMTSANPDDTKDDYGEDFRNVLKITLQNQMDQNVISAIQKLQERANKDIYWAEPVYYNNGINMMLSSGSNSLDSDFANYWLDIIRLPQAKTFIENNNSSNYSDAPIRVAVIDSEGVKQHSDFTITVLDSNGISQPVSMIETGINLMYPNRPVSHPSGYHGTRCSRMLCATVSIEGVQTASIYPIVPPAYEYAMDEDSEKYHLNAESYLSSIINELNDQEIIIASMSLSESIHNMCNIVTATNILNNYKGLLIVSIGNYGDNVDNPTILAHQRFPAMLTSNNIISVGASTENDTMWTGSNYGTESVDIIAPGDAIFDVGTEVDENGNRIPNWASGTSYSTPMVAGVAALMKYVNPDLSPLQIKAILLNTVNKKTAFTDKCVSGGRLNAYEAVRIAYELGQDNPSLTQEDINKANYLFHASTNEIIKYLGNESYPTIPQTIHGTNVTKIGDSAFSQNNYITSINIPNYITEIAEKAFRGCIYLKTVTIPSSITEIHDYTFQKCINLKEVILPNTITAIGEKAFASCSDLETITLPPSLTSIGAGAFYSSVLIYTSYDGVAYNYAVTNNIAVCSISGNTVNSYFMGSSGITRDIDIPETFFGTNITSIGGHAFDGASDIESVDIPSNVDTIGYRAFRNCTALKTIIIPSSVTSISNSMNSTILEGSTNAIIYCSRSSYTWHYAQSSNITCVGMNVHASSQSVSVTELQEYDGWGTEYYIPEIFEGYTVTSIDPSAFYIDPLTPTNITKVFVPATIESIGSNAFSNSPNMTDIYIYSAETTIGSNCFNAYDRENLTIHCHVTSPAHVYAASNGYSIAIF